MMQKHVVGSPVDSGVLIAKLVTQNKSVVRVKKTCKGMISLYGLQLSRNVVL